MKRLLTDFERRQFRIPTDVVRMDCSYWDIDGLLGLQDIKTLSSVGKWLRQKGGLTEEELECLGRWEFLNKEVLDV